MLYYEDQQNEYEEDCDEDGDCNVEYGYFAPISHALFEYCVPLMSTHGALELYRLLWESIQVDLLLLLLFYGRLSLLVLILIDLILPLLLLLR